ncbi:uncharacterized protein [Eurosta solidaginis]|uniref:uncharacterized protein n=1 Tax=Eurosta solidaginis TaxID=178769 RepID=UPI00353173DC
MKLNTFIVLLLVWFVKSVVSQETKYLSKTTTTTADIILSDIRNAFKTVTNNTKLLNRIIPQMYETVMQKSQSTFRFEIPDDSVKNGFIKWTMERDDLVDPTFPNLTSVQQKQDRFTLSESANLLHNDTSKSEAAQSYGVNIWSTLGLEGWTGAIASDHVEPEPSDAYPSSDILMDMDSEGAFGDETIDNLNANVYIARVNDPFGNSVKWEWRNATDRLKRDVITLYSMIQCSTGCQPLIYKGYGCYCGFSGAGVPVDGIDRCCKVHDKCYEYSNCISYLEYFVPYVWKCYRRKPLCAIDHGEFGGPDSCAARLCQCDAQLSRCLRRFNCPKRKAVCYTSKVRRLQNRLLTI